MATVTAGKENFEKLIENSSILFVDFWAEWCGPCKMFGPIFEKASGSHPDIVFAKVDTELEPELAGAAGISSIPTLMAFRDGILLYREAGALPEKQFEELISAVRAVDMESVRAEIEKEKAKS